MWSDRDLGLPYMGGPSPGARRTRETRGPVTVTNVRLHMSVTDDLHRSFLFFKFFPPPFQSLPPSHSLHSFNLSLRPTLSNSPCCSFGVGRVDGVRPRDVLVGRFSHLYDQVHAHHTSDWSKAVSSASIVVHCDFQYDMARPLSWWEHAWVFTSVRSGLLQCRASS